MTKTLRGKITFALACVCLILYAVVKVLDIWGLANNVGGLGNVIVYASAYDDVLTLILFALRVLVIPVLLSLIGFIYVFTMGKNKYIKRWVYVVTAFVVLLEAICMMAGGNRFFWQLAPRIGFVIVLILLFIGFEKAGLKRWIYITAGCTYMITIVYAILRMVNFIQMFDSLVGEGMIYVGYVLMQYMILPILFPIACVLVLGYILFPEKYVKAE